MKKNKKMKQKHASAQEKALFHSGLFGHKVFKDRTKYDRKKIKNEKRNGYDMES